MNSAVASGCLICCSTESLLRCSRCKIAIYCSKEHQKLDWKKHKQDCQKILKSDSGLCTSDAKNCEAKIDSDVNSIINFVVNSSENGILSECSKKLNIESNLGNTMLVSSEHDVQVLHTKPVFRNYPEVCLKKAPPLHNGYGMTNKARYDEMINDVIRNMNAHGVCVIDNFLTNERGKCVLKEVLQMYKAGIFMDGQVVSSRAVSKTKTIRQDQIKWIDREEEQKEHCKQMRQLFSLVDYVILTANRRLNNGRMGDYQIKDRTGAMVACYPGHGTHYVKHVDNPNKDGRCITAIYYLNHNWDVETSGGLLRIFPEGKEQEVADVAPLFDRIVFFWSDRRNPHEVQPAFATRYAITLWYFDATEREEYEKTTKLSSTSK